MKLRLSWNQECLDLELEDTPFTERLGDLLPRSAVAQTWGQEVYFPIPLEWPLEPDATEVVEPGTVCYWPDGPALAIPYGSTPASRGSECRLVSRVNPLGRVADNPSRLSEISAGVTVHLSRI